ncbi:carboxylesterase [Catellatospora sp. TT07R-123]|uniref:alpha/beta fold hydrolase n=1 Tax=Catellatospora sp. TT07R-123 TaxID=2733863 RepID=UPI001B05C65F|nr:alpha/beta hydrolase [Catellatospora sp. TT07R-123]GHJ47705.1 carboxylesterase [Catellatospora sp. TT07R-123]
MKTVGAFTSENARTKFLAAYGHALDRRWPGRATTDVPTAYGTTRVYTCGPDDGTPVVLLPGAGGNALMWHRYVAELGRHRRVIAVDPVGDPGGSVQDRPIEGAEDITRWLGELLTRLDVPRAHFVGCSYGGWTALQYAIRNPAAAASLTLLDPAGFGKITGRFIAWVIVGGLAGLSPRPMRHRAAGWVRNATLRDDDVMGLAAVTMGFRRRLPVPPPLTDEELRQLTTPALVLLGEHSQLYDAAAVAQRIRTLTRAEVDLVSGAGHDLPMSCPDQILDRTGAFLDRTS